MEGLRGLAVFLVFLVHYQTLAKPWIEPGSLSAWMANALTLVGHKGVDIFFFLSGYLIYGSLIARRQPYFRFMRRRLERIYPVFSVMFLIYLALSWAYPAEDKIPHSLGAGLLFVLANFLLLPGIFPIEPIITVAWSLSYEIFFYLTTPWIVTLLSLRERDAKTRLLVMLFLSCLAGALIGWLGGPPRMLMFLGGAILYEVIQTQAFKAPSGTVALAAMIAGLALILSPAGDLIHEPGKSTILALSVLFLCHHCFAREDSLVIRGLSWTPLRWLGNISYSYYLIHGLTLKMAFHYLNQAYYENGFPNPGSRLLIWLLQPLAFALTLIPAATLYLWVEKPYSLSPASAPRGTGVASAAASVTP